MTAIDVRHPVAGLGALALMTAMFWFLSVTIHTYNTVEVKAPFKIEFTPLIPDTTRDDPPWVPPARLVPPPPIPVIGPTTQTSIERVPIGGPVFVPEREGPQIGAGTDTEALPLVRINPEFPMRAMQRGIEGWVQLEFTITAAGTVVDPVIIDSDPKRIFDDASLKAIARWKYNPGNIDGRAVERRGVRVLLRFNLDEQ